MTKYKKKKYKKFKKNKNKESILAFPLTLLQFAVAGTLKEPPCQFNCGIGQPWFLPMLNLSMGFCVLEIQIRERWVNALQMSEN